MRGPNVRSLALRVPAVRLIRTYERGWLLKDLLAGVVLTGLLAPAGVAYAAAAGLPPVSGLYATVVPLIAYAMFGPSRVMVIGPDSSLTPLIAAAVVPAVATSGGDAMTLAAALAILAGFICVAAGLARFGFVSELLSAPVRYGYLNGIAAMVIVGQAARIAGFSLESGSIADQLRQLWLGLRDGRSNAWTAAIGLTSVVIIVGLRRISSKMPASVIVMALGIGAAVVFRLDSHGVALVGDLPRGLPSPSLPELDWEMIRTLWGAALGIAFVSFADTSVLSRAMSLRRREPVDANHELVALGLTNVATGVFGGFPVSASQSRTPVAASIGARTQLTGVTAAAVAAAVAVATPNIFVRLPEASLAAIVVAAAISIVDVPALVRLFRVRRSEFMLSIAAFASVAALGPITGVVVAVILSVMNFLRLAWKPHTAELVRVDGLKGYHDRSRHPEGHRITGLLLYRFDAPLVFANARYFAEDLERRIEAQPSPVRCVILTAEPVTDIDTTAGETLRELLDDLDARGIELRFAELKGQVRDRLFRYELLPDHDSRRFARTTGEAVKQYVADFGVEWTDWEDR